MEFYKNIRESCDIREVYRRYTGENADTKKVLCPFHPDRTPSMSFRNNRFRCFACGENGSAIDFVMKLYHISVSEASKMLVKDFSLQCGEITPLKKKIVLTSHFDKIKAFSEWETKSKSELAEIHRALFRSSDLLLKYNHLDYVEYLLNCLNENDFELKCQVYHAANKKINELKGLIKHL